MSDAISGNGIRTRTYKSQAIVYFEGDKSESIYILKKGKVLLTYLRPETGEEIKEEVRPGEFFGVKSALGKYPREENAQTMGETVILVLAPGDFEKIVLSNVQVVKKMLRVFSNQLRRIGRAVREVMGESNSVDPANELFKIAQYYSEHARLQQALYAYKKYMEHYPDGKYASSAMKMIKSIESGNYSESSVIPMVQEDLISPASSGFADEPVNDFMGSDLNSGSNFDDFEEDTSSFTSASDFGGEEDDSFSVSDELSDFGSEMDSFVSNDLNNDVLDDFGFDESLTTSPEEKLHEAVSFRENGDFSHALSILNEIRDDVDVSNSDVTHQAIIEIGRCKVAQGKLQEALSEFSLFVKNNAQSKYVKEALFEVGGVYLTAGSIEKANAYLKKVAAMPPRDEINQKALALLKKHKFG